MIPKLQTKEQLKLLFSEIMLFHIRTVLLFLFFFPSPKGKNAHQLLIALLVVQIDLFYEIIFSVLIDFFLPSYS